MKRHTILSHVTLSLLLLISTACSTAQNSPAADKQSRLSQGQALFEEKCRTVAGEKIYRKVQDVDGIVLLKVRPKDGPAEWADPMWPEAAFATERREREYIESFLGYEHSSSSTGEPVTPGRRGYINNNFQADNPSNNLPGYRYVDIPDAQDGKRYRYKGQDRVVGKKDLKSPDVQLALKNNPNYDLNVYRYVLDKAPTQLPAPRYGVTYEDHVIAEERALGLASSTVKVLDLQSGEVLGEMTRYAYAPGKATSSNPHPWLRAYQCPKNTGGSSSQTRQFVDQVLIPKKGN